MLGAYARCRRLLILLLVGVSQRREPRHFGEFHLNDWKLNIKV